jgi:hypothetical protein
MNRWSSAGRGMVMIIAAGAFCTALAGCPPRKPTPVATPASDSIRHSYLVPENIISRAIQDTGRSQDTAGSRDTARSHLAGVHRRGVTYS